MQFFEVPAGVKRAQCYCYTDLTEERKLVIMDKIRRSVLGTPKEVLEDIVFGRAYPPSEWLIMTREYVEMAHSRWIGMQAQLVHAREQEMAYLWHDEVDVSFVPDKDSECKEVVEVAILMESSVYFWTGAVCRLASLFTFSRRSLWALTEQSYDILRREFTGRIGYCARVDKDFVSFEIFTSCNSPNVIAFCAPQAKDNVVIPPTGLFKGKWDVQVFLARSTARAVDLECTTTEAISIVGSQISRGFEVDYVGFDSGGIPRIYGLQSGLEKSRVTSDLVVVADQDRTNFASLEVIGNEVRGIVLSSLGLSTGIYSFSDLHQGWVHHIYEKKLGSQCATRLNSFFTSFVPRGDFESQIGIWDGPPRGPLSLLKLVQRSLSEDPSFFCEMTISSVLRGLSLKFSANYTRVLHQVFAPYLSQPKENLTVGVLQVLVEVKSKAVLIYLDENVAVFSTIGGLSFEMSRAEHDKYWVRTAGVYEIESPHRLRFPVHVSRQHLVEDFINDRFEFPMEEFSMGDLGNLLPQFAQSRKIGKRTYDFEEAVAALPSDSDLTPSSSPGALHLFLEGEMSRFDEVVPDQFVGLLRQSIPFLGRSLVDYEMQDDVPDLVEQGSERSPSVLYPRRLARQVLNVFNDQSRDEDDRDDMDMDEYHHDLGRSEDDDDEMDNDQVNGDEFLEPGGADESESTFEDLG